MSGYSHNYYRDPYGYGYIQRLPTYNYTGYYQLAQFILTATIQLIQVLTIQPTQVTI